MGTRNARIYTGRDDCDGGPRCRCWAAWWAACLWTTAQTPEDDFTAESEAAVNDAFERWHAQAKARHQSLDGVHPVETAKVDAT